MLSVAMQSSLRANCPSEENVSQGIPADRGLLLQAEPKDSWDMERVFLKSPKGPSDEGVL